MNGAFDLFSKHIIASEVVVTKRPVECKKIAKTTSHIHSTKVQSSHF